MNDLYSDLGVNKDASKEEIKNAYRDLAKKNHPDKPTGDKEKFQQIQLAYQILGNDEKKSRYDSTGQTSKPNFDSVMSGYISGILQEVISSGKDIDIVDFIKKVTVQQISTIKKNIKETEKKVVRLNKLMESVKIKKGRDYITPIFQDNIRSLNASIEIMKEEMKTTEEILEVLTGYEYDYTPQFVAPDLTGQQMFYGRF